LCRVAREEGWTVKGIEVNEIAIQHCRTKYHVEYTSIDEIADSSVDAITCHHVLENVVLHRDFLHTC
jgi:hypothetical protein